MRLSFKRRWMNRLAIALLLLVGAVIGLGIFATWDRRSADVKEFAAIRDDWERAEYGHPTEGNLWTALFERQSTVLTQQEKEATGRKLAQSCVDLAEKYPDATGGLAALILATGRGGDTDGGAAARQKLISHINNTDLSQLDRAIKLARVPMDDALVVPILQRVKRSADHPQAASLLTKICLAMAADADTEEPPPYFQEAADLLVAHCADRREIANLCECLGNGLNSPLWAAQFEPHVQKIARLNQDRWVRCTAAMALASMAQSSPDRQEEAQQRYEEFLRNFDGQTQYSAQQVEQELRRRAELALTALKFVPTGRAVPPIKGIDLSGKPIALSDYQGKVVLLSFWATWCAPCMKLIPHEIELFEQHRDAPFAIVGVNADTDTDALNAALAKYNIAWRSFRDSVEGQPSISDQWNAVYPTIVLIDHKGIIRQRFSGSPPPDVLQQRVAELIKEAQDD